MKSELIYKNGKYYKESTVVMLATDIEPKEWPIGQLLQDGGDLFINKTTRTYKTVNIAIPQHLYFLSNDEIKQGDWYLYYALDIPELMQCRDSDEAYRCNNHYSIKLICKKIIASTDKTLGLPSPLDDFLEKYCELGGIDKVLIEHRPHQEWESDANSIRGWYNHSEILVVSHENTINILEVEKV